eukprot:552487-Pyramimonas_sp.AAC.1
MDEGGRRAPAVDEVRARERSASPPPRGYSRAWRATQDSWNDARSAPTPTPRPDDPMGGLPMYVSSIDRAEVARDEPAPDKISRLQKTLGGAFNRVWSAW